MRRGDVLVTMRWPSVLGTGFGGIEMGQVGSAALGHHRAAWREIHPTQSAEASSDAGRNTGRRTSFSGVSCHSCCDSTNRCEVFLHVWTGRRARKGKEHWQEGAVVAQKPISCLTAETHRIHCPHLNRKPVFVSWPSPTSAQSTHYTEYPLQLN